MGLRGLHSMLSHCTHEPRTEVQLQILYLVTKKKLFLPMRGYSLLNRLESAQGCCFMHGDGWEATALCCGGPHSSHWARRGITLSVGDLPRCATTCSVRTRGRVNEKWRSKIPILKFLESKNLRKLIFKKLK